MRAFDTIIPFISSSVSDKGSVIHVDDHSRVKLRPDCFFPVSAMPGSLVFVDGGNGEILKGPNVSVQFCRLAASWYDAGVRVKRLLREFFVVVIAGKKDLDVVFDVRVFSMDGDLLDNFVVDSLEPSLRQGPHRVSAFAVGNYARVLEEMRFAKELLKDLSDTVLVRDGDLLLSGPHMEEELRRLRLASEKRGVPVIGLSKTSHLCTDMGASALSAVSSLAPVGSWFYFSDGSVGFTRLHPKSRYVFRFDIFPHDRENLPDIISRLASVSADPVFIGYPYGLVEVDKFARVSEHDVRQLRARFAVQSKGVFDQLEAAVDAHDILNSL